jgi:GNAT superfamily N-acetyltransferase
MTSGSLTVRTLGPDDVAFAVAAVAAAQPDHPWQDELRTYWRMSERMGEVANLVIEEAGRAVGWVCTTLWRDAPKGEGRLFVFFPGAGPDQVDQAWALAERAAEEQGVRLGRANIWENDREDLAVLEGRGWERKRRERFWRLDLTGRRDHLVALRDEARRRVEAGGVRITTAAELGGEAIYPVLHQVDEVTSVDIPRSLPHVPMPYEAWLEWMRPPGVLPERLWVAVIGDRPAGLSYLDFRGTPVSTGYSGVLPELRGRGVARALKLETLVQAAELGVEIVQTDNDSQNAPILHLNEELGYREIPGLISLHKPLAGA